MKGYTTHCAEEGPLKLRPKRRCAWSGWGGCGGEAGSGVLPGRGNSICEGFAVEGAAGAGVTGVGARASMKAGGERWGLRHEPPEGDEVHPKRLLGVYMGV